MKAKDILEKIKAAVKEAKGKGHNTISIDAFDKYLSTFKKEDGTDTYHTLEHEQEVSLTEFKVKNDINIANAKILASTNLEEFKSVILSGQSALKSCMVINGGAAVAVLAFTGKIWQTSVSYEVANALTTSIFIFCLGVLFAGLASGITYCSQSFYHKKWMKLGNVSNFFSISFVLLSYALFFWGAYIAASSFGTHFDLPNF